MVDSAKKAARKAKDSLKNTAKAFDDSLGNSPSKAAGKVKEKAKSGMYALGDSFNKSGLSVDRSARRGVKELDQSDSNRWRDLKKASTPGYQDDTPLPDTTSKQKKKAPRADSDSICQETTSDRASQESRPQSRSGTPTLSGKGPDSVTRKERRSKPTHKQAKSGTFLVDNSDTSLEDELAGEFDQGLAGSFGAFVKEPTQAAWRDSVTLGPGAAAPTKPSPALPSSSFSRLRPTGSFVPPARPSSASSNRSLTRQPSTTGTIAAVQTTDEAVENWGKKK